MTPEKIKDIAKYALDTSKEERIYIVSKSFPVFAFVYFIKYFFFTPPDFHYTFYQDYEDYRYYQSLIKKSMKPTLKLIHESIWQSIAKDTITFGGMAIGLWFNYHTLGNNSVTAFLIVMLFLVSAILRANTYIRELGELTTKEEAQKFIDEYYA